MTLPRPSASVPATGKRANDVAMTPSFAATNCSWRALGFIASVVAAMGGLNFPIADLILAGVSPLTLDPRAASEPDLRLDAQLEALFQITSPWLAGRRRCVGLILPTGAGKTAVYGLAGKLLDVLYPHEKANKTVTFVVIPLAAYVLLVKNPVLCFYILNI